MTDKSKSRDLDISRFSPETDWRKVNEHWLAVEILSRRTALSQSSETGSRSTMTRSCPFPGTGNCSAR